MTMTVDLLFTNAAVYNVFLKEWFVEDVAVHQGRTFTPAMPEPHPFKEKEP